MSFCHYLVSVVCHPFTFHILIFSSENPRPNELKLGRKHLKSAHFDMIHYQTWPSQAILVSEWPICFKFSSLKPLVQMNRNLVGSIYGMSSEDCSFRPDRLANMATTETWLESSMECPLWRLLISSRSVSKHGHHRNLVGSIYGMSSMKIAHFVLIG